MYIPKHSIELETKPDFDQCMDRVYAWYNYNIIDRVPVRFSAHNAEFNKVDQTKGWSCLKDRWFDTEYQLDTFEKGLQEKEFLGETFPVYCPHLGPNIYPGMIGGKEEYGETTTWSHPVLKDSSEWAKIGLSRESEHFLKLDEMTKAALSRCKDKYLVGYTDIHTGVSAADAVRGTMGLLTDMYDDPDSVYKLVEACSKDFKEVFHYFNDLLKTHGQLSVNWLNVPSFESIHIPGCDLAAMLSNDFFDEFALPFIRREVLEAKHNIFHVDGKDVARHLDRLLEIDEICGYQWVQGVAEDEPIMQWLPLIKKIQERKKGVIVDLKTSELDEFMERMDPLGIYLCISTDSIEEQREILKKLHKWK